VEAPSGERLRGKRQVWCLLQVKLCDPCPSALKWFVYHARRYTSAGLLSYMKMMLACNVVLVVLNVCVTAVFTLPVLDTLYRCCVSFLR